ncbi:D(2) dopamine receptor B-like [Dreissena polymorpha]|uniref:G-protein coupled receptors family 1 profile domain-containing protein n=1 Tax=Dreissena polymorpha TaxID=45954 RepID=A0A9D4L0I5_DREPO|nr:D(2) dopamine receptor B-like [Dreissena polymorpha]KAH3848472.1 hypothetical protein DPMN_090837 [Dreissena polymorpha]
MDINITKLADWTFAKNNLGMIVNETDHFYNDRQLELINDHSLVYRLPAIIFCGIMMLVGLPGNMVVFYVYFFKWRKSTSRIFILFLAVLDMFNSATILPMEIFVMKNYLKLNSPFLCKIFRYGTYVMNCSSALILVGIALDRFQRICRPYKQTFSEWTSKCICIGAIVVALCVTWPSLVLYGTRTTRIANITSFSCSLQNNYDVSSYPMAYFALLTSTTAIVFAVLIILYYAIGIQIYKHRQFKKKKCSHVQTIIDEKSITVKSDHEQSKDVNGGHTEPHDVNPNVTPAQTNNTNNELKHDQIMPDADLETSCAYLEIKKSDEPNAVQNGSAMNEMHHMKDVDGLNGAALRQTSAEAHVKKIKRKKQRIRYMLVRGSSTLTASGRNRCSNCITVRIGRSTMMLFFITIAYVLSFLPFYTLVIMRQINPMYFMHLPETSKASYTAYLVFVRSYILSSAINPLIYSFCNIQFRNHCKELFKKIVSADNLLM